MQQFRVGFLKSLSKWPMHAFYADHFVLPLPEGHRFPMGKYSRLRARLRQELTGLQITQAPAATDGELALAHSPGPGFAMHSEMAVPYIVNFGSEEMKARWLPRLCSGEAISGIAMSEPSGGSDLHAMRTRARHASGGWSLSGQKVFISNGQLGDVFVVAAKTADTDAMSLFVVESDRPGFKRGRNLEKLGHHAQDTSELFFDEVLLPAENLIGEAGRGVWRNSSRLHGGALLRVSA